MDATLGTAPRWLLPAPSSVSFGCGAHSAHPLASLAPLKAHNYHLLRVCPLILRLYILSHPSWPRDQNTAVENKHSILFSGANEVFLNVNTTI